MNSLKSKIMIKFIFISDCVVGQYLGGDNGCTSCDASTFQDSPFHKEAAYKNCSSMFIEPNYNYF